MAKTLANLKLSLAYRLGESSVPNDTSETARRLSFLNEAYQAVMREHYWWFTEASATFNSVANQASYSTADGIPTDLRAILELRFQDTLYEQITQKDGMDSQTLPYKSYSQSYFLFAGSIYFVSPLTSTVTAGVALKYYKDNTALSSDSDTILLPDKFSDCLVSYAYGRVSQVKGKRGSASDGFEDYNDIVKKMQEEQNKYLFSLKASTNDAEIVGTYQ